MFILIYVFDCDGVLVEARRIFDFLCSRRILGCGMWDLALRLGIEPGPPALGVGRQSLDHQGSPNTVIFNEKFLSTNFIVPSRLSLCFSRSLPMTSTTKRISASSCCSRWHP